MSNNDQDNGIDPNNDQVKAVLKAVRAKPGPKLPELQEVVIEAKLVGRDKKPIPPREVYKLAALGCTKRDVANFFGVAEDNITRHFAEEYAKGREDMKISLRRAMLNNAVTNNNAVLQIFLAKNFLGMSDSPLDNESNKPLPWTENE